MSRIKYFLTFFLFTIFSLPCFADSDLTNLDRESLNIYHYHREKCIESKFSLIDGFDWQTMRASAEESFSSLIGDKEALLEFLALKGRSSVMEKYLSSEGYYLALRDCFGDDQTAKNLYTIGIISSDFLGKVGNITGLKGISMAFEKLLFSQLTIKVSRWIKGGLVVVGTGALTWSFYDEFRPRTEEENKAYSKIVDSYFQPIDNALAINIEYFEELIELKQRQIYAHTSSEIEIKKARDEIIKLEELIQKIKANL